MLEQILTHLHNWFVVRIHPGKYTISDGSVALPFLQSGQHYRIMGSLFNDGLHRYGDEADKLMDETFSGAIWALAIPRAVLDLAENMEKWQKEYGEKAAGIYQSESKADYSYSKRTGSDGSVATVWDVFQTRLNPYRKLREI